MNHTKSQFKTSILMPFALLIFLLVACDKEDIDISEQDSGITDSTILFEFEYLNFAWGFSHFGWFIDNQGQIRGYNQPNNWKVLDSSGYITKDSLLYNYNQTDTLLGQIDLDKLNDKSKLIEGSLDGELSEIDCHGADIGSLALYSYYWDSEKNKYRRQFLFMTGDCEQYNTADDAKELTEFLKTVY